MLPDPVRCPARRSTAVLVALVVALGASACAGGSGADDGAQLPGTLEFGLTEGEFSDHVERTQALIAECMAAQGFEYVPVDARTIQAAQARVRQDPGVTRREYKEQWGLGVTTRSDNPVRDTGLGPNLQIMQGLSDADRDAYVHALWGDEPRADFVFTLDEEDFSSTDGCTREAVEQVFTDDQLRGAYVNPKDVLVDSDPRIVEARENWSACMRERGYEYEEDQDEIIEEYQERLEELTEGEDPETLTGARAEALQALQEEEIAVSLADLECQIEHTDEIYRQVELEVFGKAVSG